MKLAHLMVAAVACLAGCTSISVTPITDKNTDQDGIRFALPATFLLVTPQADGTMGYEWISLPDRALEYTIEQDSMLASFTMDIQLENGMLKSVGGKQDSSQVVAKAIPDLSALANAYVQAQIAAQKAGGGGGRGLSGGNVVSAAGASQGPTGRFEAPGPVLLRVVQTADQVKLVPVKFAASPGTAEVAQSWYWTNVVLKAENGGGTGGGGKPKSECTVNGKVVTVTVKPPIFAPKQNKVMTAKKDGAPDIKTEKYEFKTDQGKTATTVVVTFAEALPAGTNEIVVSYSPKQASPGSEDTILSCKIAA